MILFITCGSSPARVRVHEFAVQLAEIPSAVAAALATAAITHLPPTIAIAIAIATPRLQSLQLHVLHAFHLHIWCV